jgi:hypothetical protein
VGVASKRQRCRVDDMSKASMAGIGGGTSRSHPNVGPSGFRRSHIGSGMYSQSQTYVGEFWSDWSVLFSCEAYVKTLLQGHKLAITTIKA